VPHGEDGFVATRLSWLKTGSSTLRITMRPSALSGRQRGVSFRFPLNDGNTMPGLGFGTYRLPPGEARAAVATAIGEGFRHIDCAKIYGNQKEVGEGIKDALSSRRLQRDQLFITSKLWPTQLRPEWVRPSCELTLRELGTDYLDLLLIHWPVVWKSESYDRFASDAERYSLDDATGQSRVETAFSLKDTWTAMCDLVNSKRVKSIGVSNFSEADLLSIMSSDTLIPVTNQVEIHPGLKQNALRSFHSRYGIHTTAYCPFGMPTRFTPANFPGVMMHSYFNNDVLYEQCGFRPSRLLLNWNLDSYNSVLVKSSTPARIADNAKAETGTMSTSIRWYVDTFEAKESIRVINPTTFRGDGKSFFEDRKSVESKPS
jgi:diketogulonate reductase-like aldo/keto reductase